jgi:hypothetical protein
VACIATLIYRPGNQEDGSIRRQLTGEMEYEPGEYSQTILVWLVAFGLKVLGAIALWAY